jgi:hypothetical protein
VHRSVDRDARVVHTPPVVDFSAIETCGELNAEHADAAAASRDAMRKLLAHVAQIARPGEGCPKVLIIVARLARGDVTWIQGAVCADLEGDESSTLLSILTELGPGLYEPVFPTLRLDAPMDEFLRAVKLAPKLIAPLKAEESNGKILLSREAPAAKPAGDFDLDDPFAEPPAGGAELPPAAAGPLPTEPLKPGPTASPEVHTRPTVRRMVAVDPSLFGKRVDPRREDDD